MSQGDAAAGGVLLTISIIVAAYQTVGTAGLLAHRSLPLTLVATFILAVVALGLLATGRAFRPAETKRSRAQRLSATQEQQGVRRPSFRFDPFIAAWLLPAVALHAAAITRALRMTVYGWDATWYHLPIAIRRSQTGTFGDPFGLAEVIRNHPNFVTATDFYPGNANLFHMLAVEAFGHIGARLAQLPFLLLGGFFVYRIALVAGTSRRGAALGGIVFATVPVVVFQTTTSYADLITATMLLGGVLLGMVWWRDGLPVCALLSGLGFGLALGSKWASVPFVAALGGLVVLGGILRARRSRPFVPVFLFMVGVILPSAFWFARAWSIVESPIVPLRLALGDRVIFEGVSFRTGKELQYLGLQPVKPLVAAWIRQPFVESPPTEEVGAGIALVALGVTGYLLSVLAALGRNRRLTWLALFTSLALAAWWFTNHEPRHAIVGMGIGAALTALVPDAFPQRLRPLFFSFALVLVATNSWWIWRHYDRARPLIAEFSTPACGAFANPVAEAVDRIPDGAMILNDLTLSRDGSITNCNYALLGPDFEHRVIWEPGLFLPEEPRQASLFLRGFGVDYVFVRSESESKLPDRYRSRYFDLYFEGESLERQVWIFRVR